MSHLPKMSKLIAFLLRNIGKLYNFRSFQLFTSLIFVKLEKAPKFALFRFIDTDATESNLSKDTLRCELINISLYYLLLANVIIDFDPGLRSDRRLQTLYPFFHNKNRQKGGEPDVVSETTLQTRVAFEAG